jgi:hypothetical protein
MNYLRGTLEYVTSLASAKQMLSGLASSEYEQ